MILGSKQYVSKSKVEVWERSPETPEILCNFNEFCQLKGFIGVVNQKLIRCQRSTNGYYKNKGDDLGKK